MRKGLAVVLVFAAAPPACGGMLSILLGAALLPGERDAGLVALAVGTIGLLISLGLCITVYAALQRARD